MGYGKEIYQQASAMLEKRRTAAQQRSELALLDFYAACPRAEEISRAKSSLAAGIARAVLSGSDVKKQLTALRDKSMVLQAEYDQLLEANGLAQDMIDPDYSCMICQDTGFVDGRMCSCLSQLQKQLAYEQLNMNVPLDGSSFEKFSLDFYEGSAKKQMEQIYKYCTAYANNFHQHSSSLLFRGATGLGKTHLSLAIASVATDKGFGVIYGSAQSFAVTLEKERFVRQEGPSQLTTEQKLQQCDLLILDDLGMEFQSSYVTAVIYNVINDRILSGRPTIISTNLSLKEMEGRYGARFVSRISGHFGSFEFMGSDIRIQKRKKQRNGS